MKKYLMLLAIAAGFTTTTGLAQTKEQKESDEKMEKKEKIIVPATVKDVFAKQYRH